MEYLYLLSLLSVKILLTISECSYFWKKGHFFGDTLYWYYHLLIWLHTCLLMFNFWKFCFWRWKTKHLIVVSCLWTRNRVPYKIFLNLTKITLWYIYGWHIIITAKIWLYVFYISIWIYDRITHKGVYGADENHMVETFSK